MWRKMSLLCLRLRRKYKKVPIAFVIKEEVEELEGIEIVQKKVDLSVYQS
jgi:pyrimidine operon attenuation protein/uracil phosphoribosyltransferase